MLLFMLLVALFVIYSLIWMITGNKKHVGEPDISLPQKIFSVSILLLLIVVPLAAMAIIFSFFLYGLGSHNHIFTFDSALSAFTTAFYILVSFIAFETILRALVYKILFFIFRHEPQWIIYQVASIVTVTVILWLVGSTVPGTHITGIQGALSFSVLFHIIEWSTLLIRKVLKNMNKIG